ncbi:MAG: galactose mutarotase [Muribaculaceae bacterium]
MKLETTTFQTDLGEITWLTLTNKRGAQIVLSSLGAGIVAVRLPEGDGKMTDVVIGYDDPMAYLADGPCSGKTPGRYANRIAKGHFKLDGVEYTLPVNNGPNHLHGGPDGYQNRIWNCTNDGDSRVVFSLESQDGDAGYPGNLKATVAYEWDDNNCLTINYRATTDAPTVVNLTNHAYFNMDGHDSGDGLSQILKLNCSKWLPTDSTLIPTGEIASVEGTPMDFTKEHTIGERINDEFDALKFGKGYDNCWLVDNYDGTLKEVASLRSEKSGHKVTVITTQPAAQVYSGNWLEGCPTGKNGATYHDYAAVAIECQGCPDAPNQPGFPSQRLNPGVEYHQVIKFAFE